MASLGRLYAREATNLPPASTEVRMSLKSLLPAVACLVAYLCGTCVVTLLGN
jgi:hypothetical protein